MDLLHVHLIKTFIQQEFAVDVLFITDIYEGQDSLCILYIPTYTIQISCNVTTSLNLKRQRIHTMTCKQIFKKCSDIDYCYTYGNSFSMGIHEYRLKYTVLKIDIGLYCDC